MRKHRWLWFFMALLLVNGAILVWWYVRGREHRYDGAIIAAARKYGVNPALVKAVVWKESRFDHTVRGKAGELGLMQIRELAAQEWATAEKRGTIDHSLMLDPQINTQAGTWYLRKLLNRYRNTDNPLPYALADYNAGRTQMLKWIKGPASTNSAAFMEKMDYPGTKQYIQDITERFQYYQPEFQQTTAAAR